jgi:hypothetical protein
MGLGPLAAIWLRCIGASLETQRSGGPSTKEDLETIRIDVFAAPGLHRAPTLVSISTSESGLKREQSVFEVSRCIKRQAYLLNAISVPAARRFHLPEFL